MYKAGFIGAGNMGGALITAACRTIGPENVIITGHDMDKANELAAKTGCHIASSNIEVARLAQYVFLAVKPNIIREVAVGIADTLRNGANADAHATGASCTYADASAAGTPTTDAPAASNLAAAASTACVADPSKDAAADAPAASNLAATASAACVADPSTYAVAGASDAGTCTHTGHVVVTIAAGITRETIRKSIKDAVPVIRIMPNTPVAVGQGMILITGDGEDDPHVKELQEFMKGAGDFMYLPESSFDITTSISSCSPAYVYMFISAMADGAVQVGVPRNQAIRLAAKTVLGSAQMVLETGIHPDQLKDNVCSPGGSTIAGVNVLEENRFRYAAAQAIIKSTERNLELGK